MQRRSTRGKGGRKAKGTNIPVWGPRAYRSLGPSAAKPQRRSLPLPHKLGEKIFEPVYSARNDKRSEALTRATHM